MTSVLSVLLLTSLVACGWLAVMMLRLRRDLAESKRAFFTLVENAPVGVVQTDAAGYNVFCNAAWCEISGLPADETGDGWRSVVHPDDLPMVTARWEHAVQTRQPYVNELRLVRPDGTDRSIVAVVHPMFDEQDAVAGFIGMVLDVTELRDVRRQVRTQDAVLQDLIDHSTAAIYLKDAAGRYLVANKQHMAIWPAMRDFRPGTTPYDWFPKEVADSFVESDKEVIESGQTRTFEETIPSAVGPRTYLSVKFPVRDDAGTTIAVGGISTDVTEQEEARRQLAEREQLLRNLIELQENERQLICHEFHDGLIQYVVGATMLLERLHDDPQLPEAHTATLESVIKCLSKGLEDARRVIRGIRPASLDDLGLKAAIDDLVGELQADGVDVQMVLRGDLEQVDEDLHTTIYRVIQELFNNATKHSGTQRLQLSLSVDEGGIEIDVQDFGSGFDPSLPTAGFGLTGIRERVQLVGGTYQLRSAPGEGTRVTVQLPLHPSPSRLAAGVRT